MIKKTLTRLAPPEFFELTVYLIFLLAGTYTLSPWRQDNSSPAIESVFATHTAIIIYGIILVSIGVAGMVGVFHKTWAWRFKIRSWAMLGAFSFFLFIVLLRLQIFGFGELLWVTYFLNALACAVSYLHVKRSYLNGR
jgi:hypothetical protein